MLDSSAQMHQLQPGGQARNIGPNAHCARRTAAQWDPTVGCPVGVLCAVKDVLTVGKELGLPVGPGVIDFLLNGEVANRKWQEWERWSWEILFKA